MGQTPPSLLTRSPKVSIFAEFLLKPKSNITQDVFGSALRLCTSMVLSGIEGQDTTQYVSVAVMVINRVLFAATTEYLIDRGCSCVLTSDFVWREKWNDKGGNCKEQSLPYLNKSNLQS